MTKLLQMQPPTQKELFAALDANVDLIVKELGHVTLAQFDDELEPTQLPWSAEHERKVGRRKLLSGFLGKKEKRGGLMSTDGGHCEREKATRSEIVTKIEGNTLAGAARIANTVPIARDHDIDSEELLRQVPLLQQAVGDVIADDDAEPVTA